MGYVFQREWMDVMKRIGGISGLAAVLIACVGVAGAALRFRASLYDPLLLLALCGIGLVFAANFAAGAFASPREQAWMINGDAAAKDREMVFGKTVAAASFGLVSWAGAMAAGIQTMTVPVEPPWDRLAVLALLTFTASWANASLAALLCIRMTEEVVARRLVRGPAVLAVLLLVTVARVAPEPVARPLFRALRGPQFPVTVLVLTVFFALLAYWLSRKTLAALDERRHPLTILGEQP